VQTTKDKVKMIVAVLVCLACFFYVALAFQSGVLRLPAIHIVVDK
jgi:hypothetical protein